MMTTNTSRFVGGDVVLVLGYALLAFSCRGSKSDCDTCGSDDDCESGFCESFSFGQRCAEYASGAHTDCCIGTSCEIFYGSGRKGHGCVGAPFHGTCASCATDLNGCSSCLGCASTTVTAGNCSGTLALDDCASCAAWIGRDCSMCAGCTTGSAACSGSCWDVHQQAVCESLGCTWTSTNAYCRGTPQTSCSSFTDATSCRAASNAGACLWSECSGTLTPCTQLSSSQEDCMNQKGCSWSPAIKSCDGTLTPCSQLTSATCESQSGCSYQ
jgi:hypothetical protein